MSDMLADSPKWRARLEPKEAVGETPTMAVGTTALPKKSLRIGGNSFI